MGLLRKPVRTEDTLSSLLPAVSDGPGVRRAVLIRHIPEVFVAIYHCSHRKIGKATHSAGTAGAHIRYITRPSAQADIVAGNIPAHRTAAQHWMDDHEALSRKNARVCDKIEIALPIEFTPEQRRACVRDFAEQLTQQKASYFAALHQYGNDQHNPHAHLVLVDKDIQTGKRVIGTSERGSTEKIRQLWEHTCNTHLALNGFEQRIDRRTLEAQGSRQTPQIHIGPKAQFIEAAIQKPHSQTRTDHRGRTIHYPQIDQGRTRREFNDQIIDANLRKAQRAPDRATRERARLTLRQRGEWRQWRQDQIQERRVGRAQYLSQREALYQQFRQHQRALIEAREHTLQAAQAEQQAVFTPQWRVLYRQQANEVKALQQRIAPTLLPPAQLRQNVREGCSAGLQNVFNDATHIHDEADLQRRHRQQRRALAKQQRQQQKALRHAIKDRYRPLLAEQRMDWQLRRAAARAGPRQRGHDARQAEAALKAQHQRERVRLEKGLQHLLAQPQRSANDRGAQLGLQRGRWRGPGLG